MRGVVVETDTGEMAAVPEDEQLDVDGGEGSDATEGGVDLEAAAWAFAHPDGAVDA